MQLRASLLSVLLSAACGANPPSPAPPVEPPAARPTPTPAAEPPGPSAGESERQKADDAARKKLAQLEVDAKAERARFDDELRSAVKALGEKKFPNPRAAIQAALASPHRLPGHAERDPHRRPLQTLTFLGFRQDSTVLELGGGDGWYTEILAPLLRSRGKLVVTALDPKGPETAPGTFYGRRFRHYLDKSEELSGKVEVVVVDPQNMVLGHAGEIDLALAFRELHNWHRRGRRVKSNLEQIHAALKPGGTLGVVQHRAAEGANPDESAEKGYLPQAWVIEQAVAVGFVLVAKSEVNANAKDTKDYPEGVWSLPPTLRQGDEDREKYLAIGESDRMTLKFQKRVGK